MKTKHLDYSAILKNAMERYREGLDPSLIELPECAVFPGIIPAAPATARKSRCTGLLLGRPAPRFIRRGRSIRYRLLDIFNWLADVKDYASTAEAAIAEREACFSNTEHVPTFAHFRTHSC